MEINKLSSEEFKKIYSKVPRLCVDLVIQSNDGVVLCLRNLPSWHNQWTLPGGTVYYKETIEQAAKRMAKRELGISIEIIKILGYIEYPSEEKERGFGWSVSIALLCKTSEQKFITSEESSKIEVFKVLPQGTNIEHSNFLAEHWKEIVI